MLRARGKRPMLVVGHSKSATTVMLYLSKYTPDHSLAAVALSARFDYTQTPLTRFSEEQRRALENGDAFDWGRLPDRPTMVTAEGVAERGALGEMSDVDKKIASSQCRLLLMHCDDDKSSPREDFQRHIAHLQSGAGNVRIVELPAGGHFFEGVECQDAVCKAIVDFVGSA